MKSRTKLQPLSFALYRVISKSPLLSKLWLSLAGAFLRAIPDFPLKENIVNNLTGFSWSRSLSFGPKSVSVCSGVTVSLIPHVGEYDFRAAFSRSLCYEAHVFRVLAQRIQSYDAVLEIGANVGVYSLFFRAQRSSEAVPVFCLEPSPEAFKRLLANLEIDSGPNVYPIPAAVSEKTGVVPFFEPTGHLTNGSLIEGFASSFSETVHRRLVLSLGDSQVAELLQPYHHLLLKIDVEGAEPDVLGALLPLVLEKEPEVVLEVLAPFVRDLNALKELRNLYKLYLITPDGLMPMQLFESHPTFRDYLLVPNRAPQPISKPRRAFAALEPRSL